jgi:opacity protein-like surface antigen
MLYMTQHTLEQGTQFNFLEQGAAGAHYYLNNNLAITADYRFRHVSNAGIDEPNGGINTSFFLLGATYRFE